MKICVIQPRYSFDERDVEVCFEELCSLLDKCDDTLDLIVLPEYSDVPCATGSLEETLYYHEKYINVLLERCKETAIRCNSLVFVNALSQEEGGCRNTTYIFQPGNGRFGSQKRDPLQRILG